MFDALNAAAVLDLHLNELNVGMGTSTTVGTLRSEPDGSIGRQHGDLWTWCLARGYWIASGAPSVGIAGSASNVIGIAYNDTTGGTAKAALDFSGPTRLSGCISEMIW